MSTYSHSGTVNYNDLKDDWNLNFTKRQDMDYEGSYSVSNTGDHGKFVSEIWGNASTDENPIWELLVKRTMSPGDTTASGTFKASTYYLASTKEGESGGSGSSRKFKIHVHWKLTVYKAHYSFRIESDKEFTCEA